MNNDDPLVGLYINYNLDASFFINKSKKYWSESLEPHTHAIHGIGVECIAWGGFFGEGKHMHWKRLKKVEKGGFCRLSHFIHANFTHGRKCIP